MEYHFYAETTYAKAKEGFTQRRQFGRWLLRAGVALVAGMGGAASASAQDPGTVNNAPIRQMVLPPAPNAANLGKYGALPVNHYTGLPKVDVPLYTIRQGTLEVPVSLSYHAALKVDDLASWVGLVVKCGRGHYAQRSRTA